MKYQLSMRVEIQQRDDYGGYIGGGLTVSEDVRVSAGNFLEIAHILGKFHELAKGLEDAKGES